MANVLGELFSNIANSIRNGLEDIGTMKPIEFPDRVAEICSLLEHYKNNSGGGEGGEGSTLPANVETGTFNTADTGIGRVFINHTLGEVPDFVMIYLTSLGDGIDPNDNQMVSVWSVKEDLYPSIIKGGQNCTDGTSMQTLGHDVATSDSYMDDYFARIYCPDDHTIRVGTDTEIDNGQVKHFFANSKYQWVAVSGLRNAVADPVVEPLTITENGTYNAPEGVDGYNPVVVNVAGSSADLRYVTFMSYDGLVEYGKKAVAVGDDCADPIARGIFAKPTRESDAQYTYTFYGWATEPNGGADANWNKAITEDKTVYANFSAAVRHYTITYYDDDGVSVLETESLAYGAMPVYEAEKEGFKFVAWQPAVSPVTGDASYTAQWKALTGLSFLSKATLTEDAYRFAVANDGKHIAAMLDSKLSYVMCYTTTSETATASKLTTSHTGSNNNIDINYDGTLVRVTKGESSSSRYVDTVSFSGERSTVFAGNATYIACSPTSNLYCYRMYANSKYSIKFSDGGSVALSASTSDMRITHGDKYLVCVQSKNIVVIDISAKSIVRTIATGLADWIASFDVSEDGTKCLVATYSEEVVVYSLKTFEKICDMSGSFSESTYAQFAGDMIVVGSGSTIRAFTIVDSAPVESFDIPAYSGGSVARMMSSHNKKYLGISDGSSIELWGNA